MDRLAMTESETREYQSVVLAALLHDIGKLLHRRNETTYKTAHHKASSLFINGHEGRLKNDNLYDLELVRFLALHHMEERGEEKEDVLNDPFLQNAKMDKERAWKLLTIVRDADIYSCAERDRDKDERKGFAYRLEPLRPIFQNIDLSPQGPSPKAGLNYRLSVLDPIECFPKTCDRLTDQEFGSLIDEFEKAVPDFTRFSSFDDVVNKWLDILQQYTCNVPSDTRYDGPDVSLYDHSRSSAAFAACLYKRHLESIRDNQQFKRANEFILIGGDYSGIQDYIFHITNRGSGGASKRLRARSFFVYLFSEATIHKILHALDLPLVCNLFSAGGKFLLLAPNIEGVADVLRRAKAEIDAEISRTYFNQFSFLLSWKEINGAKNRPSEFKIYSFYKSAEDMFHRLETEKLKKFSSVLSQFKSLSAPSLGHFPG
ncbi:MAG: type III-A CRISPR-associated protein Cas10/Csm1 [Proteobacteria bacterium]|nr:type III-A CRISPR-associated protein Cas10/Csm1 [Pseudomonadota bacterium]